jgi:glucose-6-phosphate 1-epimerase
MVDDRLTHLVATDLAATHYKDAVGRAAREDHTDARLGTMDDACVTLSVDAPDGSRLAARRHGGHVVGWTPGGGRERLWLSPLARCGPGEAIRGGIPVIFPQFAGRGPLPKHGLARDREWRLAPPPRAGSWRAVLGDDDATRAIWPHAFELTLTATAAGDRLDTELAVHNPGVAPFTFTAALHGYLALGEPGATVHGVGGLDAEDNEQGGRLVTVPRAPLVATERRDIAVRDVTGPVTLQDSVFGPLVLTADGFADRVIWNPGPDAALGDVPPGGAAGFVCIEAAQLAAVTVAPGETWTGRQTLRSG